MIIAVNHVQITIPEGCEEEARNFYCDFLGLEVVEKPEPLRKNGGFWLSIPPIQVHVGIENGVDRSKSKTHVAYEVIDSNLWREKCRKSNIEVKEGIPIEGYHRFDIRDPFGNRIEIMERV